MTVLKKMISTRFPIRWLSNVRKMVSLISAFSGSQEVNEKPNRFAVLVIPWLGTDVPWFSIIFGLFLARRGNDVSIIVDNLPFGDNYIRFHFMLWCIELVTKKIAKHHTVIHLSDYPTTGSLLPEEISDIKKLAKFNAVWALKGETSITGRKRYIKIVMKQLLARYIAIKSLIVGNPFEVVFIPGGVYSSSGVWEECARTAGIRVASYDSGGYGTLMLCTDGIAAKLQDIPRAFYMLKARPDFEQEKQIFSETALAEMQRRRAGTDRFSSQMSGKNTENLMFNNGVLIALNSSWDSAALGLHVVFENSTQWIVDTTRWLIDSTDCDIIIRQHPVERLDIACTTDDYCKLLADNFPDNSRIYFIAANDPVNTYDLLSAVKTVVVYVSTIGIEAALLGKVVITPSKSYYSLLGFVWNADTRETYFKHISNAVQGRYFVSSAMKDDATCCYYLTQCCNWISSPFNPEGFRDWSNYSLIDLYMLNTVQLSLTSIQDNIPAAVMNHLIRIKDRKDGR